MNVSKKIETDAMEDVFFFPFLFSKVWHIGKYSERGKKYSKKLSVFGCLKKKREKKRKP